MIDKQFVCYQTINDEIDGAVEDNEEPVKLLENVSWYSIPRDCLIV